MTSIQHSQPRGAVNPVGLLTLIATLCVSAQGLASEYPPPPGPYPAGPLPAVAGGGEALEDVASDVAARPVSGNRPGLLLPDVADGSASGAYGASNLFGSAPAAADPTPPPAAVFAPTGPTAPYPRGDVDAAPPAPASPGVAPETTLTQRATAEPLTYRPNPPANAGRGYQPPAAYPVGRGMPPYAAPALPQQPWRGGPQVDADMPPSTAAPSAAGGPVFRPPGSAGN